MIAKMNISNFTKTLMQNTQQGSIDYKATPFMVFSLFDNCDKIFYGSIRNNEFQLTANSIFRAVPYYLSGNFEIDGGFTKVTYQIKPNWWAFLWTRIIPLVFILVAGIFLFNSWLDLTPILVIFVTAILFPITTNFVWTKQIRQFEKKFKEILEIEG